ncbi:16721_t:CDS:1, partial [Acaulospora colombiana]
CDGDYNEADAALGNRRIASKAIVKYDNASERYPPSRHSDASNERRKGDLTDRVHVG